MKKDLGWLTKDTKYMDFIESYTEGTERGFNRFCGKNETREKELFRINDLFSLIDRYARKNGISMLQDLDYFGDYFYYLEYNGKFYKIGAYAVEDEYGNINKSEEYYFRRVNDDVSDLAIKYSDIRNNIKNLVLSRNMSRLARRPKPISRQLFVDEYRSSEEKRAIITRRKIFK